MNYTTATDLAINQALAKTLGITNCFVRPDHQMNSTGTWLYSDQCLGDALPLPDYCNDWAAIGPLFEEYYGDLVNEVFDCIDNPEGTFLDCTMRDNSCNIKRAAAICIIKVLEGE